MKIFGNSHEGLWVFGVEIQLENGFSVWEVVFFDLAAESSFRGSQIRDSSGNAQSGSSQHDNFGEFFVFESSN